MSVMDMIALFLTVPFVGKLGCRKCTLVAMSIGGLLCVVVGRIPKRGALTVIRLTSALFGKFMLSVSFNTICLWTIQLYSTTTRAKGMGWAQINGHVGSTLAPWISDLTTPLGVGAPYIALGAPVLVGVLLAVTLPEFKLDKTREKNNNYDKILQMS